VTAPAIVRRWGHGQPAPSGRRADEREATVGRAAWDLAVLRRGAPWAAVVLTGLAAQAGLAPHLVARGVGPDLLLVAVVAVAAGRGARAGAAFGFAAGLGADLFLATPLGTSALAYTLVGHVFGRANPPRPPVSAAALCTPTSTCFSCRTGRRHVAGRHDDAPSARARSSGAPSSSATASRPARRHRRIMIRRAVLRRSLALTGVAVAVGRIGTAMVATALGGVPFPTAAGLFHILGVAVLSAPFGIPALAAGRSFGRGRGAHR
jgi:hypothetical protein